MAGEYKTVQKKKLIEYLQKNSMTPSTIEEIYKGVSDRDFLGKSTVYRLINKLVEEGRVKRYVKDNSRHFVYQYVDKNVCMEHIHLKCLECGKLIHMEDSFSHDMNRKIKQSCHFVIDARQTMLFGKCEECVIKEN